MTLPSLSEAIAQGFQVYGKTERGYLVRKPMVEGWLHAEVILVPCKTHP